MPRPQSTHFLFRYRQRNTVNGVTRNAVRRVAAILGMTETQLIHKALADFIARHLPRYSADTHAPTATDIRRIRALAKSHLHKRRRRPISSLLPENEG